MNLSTTLLLLMRVPHVRKGCYMKNANCSFNLLLLLLVGGFIFAGCYTRLETFSDDGYGDNNSGGYANADSSAATGDTTGTNYFRDDGYRSLQYRTAFDYYSPSWYDWGDGIDPWYGDYDYPWDATLMYPDPYWDAGDFDYGWGLGFGFGYGLGYGRYHNGGYRGGHGGGFVRGRIRTIGSTRGTLAVRGAVPPGNSGGSFRTSGVSKVASFSSSRMRSRQEIPWWQRMNAAKGGAQFRSGPGQRPRSALRNIPMTNGARNLRNPPSYRMGAQWMNHWVRTQSAAMNGFSPAWRSSFRQQSAHSYSPQGSWARTSGGASVSRGGGGGGGSRGGRSR